MVIIYFLRCVKRLLGNGINERVLINALYSVAQSQMKINNNNFPLTVCCAIISCYVWHFHNNIAPYIISTTDILWQWISHNCQSPFVKQPITIVFAMEAKRKAHRFDLDNNCQSPGDVTAMRAARLRTRFVKRLLNEDTEPAETIPLCKS